MSDQFVSVLFVLTWVEVHRRCSEAQGPCRALLEHSQLEYVSHFQICLSMLYCCAALEMPCMALGRPNTSLVSYGLNNKLCHNDLLEFYHRNSPKSYHWKLEECLVLGQEAIALKVSFKRICIYIYIYILRFKAGSEYKAASSWLSFLINSDEGENFLAKIDNEKKESWVFI